MTQHISITVFSCPVFHLSSFSSNKHIQIKTFRRANLAPGQRFSRKPAAEVLEKGMHAKRSQVHNPGGHIGTFISRQWYGTGDFCIVLDLDSLILCQTATEHPIYIWILYVTQVAFVLIFVGTVALVAGSTQLLHYLTLMLPALKPGESPWCLLMEASEHQLIYFCACARIRPTGGQITQRLLAVKLLPVHGLNKFWSFWKNIACLDIEQRELNQSYFFPSPIIVHGAYLSYPLFYTSSLAKKSDWFTLKRHLRVNSYWCKGDDREALQWRRP